LGDQFRRGQNQALYVHDRLKRLGDDEDFCLRYAREDLERPCEVDLV